MDEPEYIELNLNNYSHDQVETLQHWAIWATFKLEEKEIMKAENEQDEIQHEIKMTDDKHYRDWYNQKKKDDEIDQFGIDED
jgi:hypothetical protein